jgi:hypothetical protein
MPKAAQASHHPKEAPRAPRRDQQFTLDLFSKVAGLTLCPNARSDRSLSQSSTLVDVLKGPVITDVRLFSGTMPQAARAGKIIVN